MTDFSRPSHGQSGVQRDRRDEEPSSPRDLLLGGLRDGVPPMIVDPKDGLPRPADESYTQTAVPAANDENFICQEGGLWRLFDEATGMTSPLGTEPQPEDATLDLVLMTTVGRQNPPGTAYDDRVFQEKGTGRLFKKERPSCQHYSEMETVATEYVAEGLEGPPRTILRQCLYQNVVLTDMVIKACNQRTPRDVVSEARLVHKAREKAALAKLAPTPLFRKARPEEMRPEVDPRSATARSFVDAYVGPGGETIGGRLFGFVPQDVPSEILRPSPLYLWFPDECWQPPAETYHNCAYTDGQGKLKSWSASLSGELVIRQVPGLEDGDTYGTLTRNRSLQFGGQIKGIAKALIEEGRNVVVVPYHASSVLMIRAAVREGVKDYFAALAPAELRARLLQLGPPARPAETPEPVTVSEATPAAPSTRAARATQFPAKEKKTP